jgi:hypothetical protein
MRPRALNVPYHQSKDETLPYVLRGGETWAYCSRGNITSKYFLVVFGLLCDYKSSNIMIT